MFVRQLTARLYRQTKNKILNLTVAATMLASSAGGLVPLLTARHAFAASTTVFNQTELVNALADAGNDVITLGQDITTTAEVVINRPVTVNGAGFAISPNFVGSGTNNSVIEIVNTDSVTLANLTIDGTNGTSIHGINIYKSTSVQLNDVTSKNNDKSGIVVNGSTVTVLNVQTAGNTWHGINVDLGSGVTEPAVLTVNGASNQTDTVHIFVDNTAEDVTVNDTNSQYATFTSGNSKTYMLKPVATITAPTAGQHLTGTLNLAAIYEDWDNGVNDDSVQWAVRKATCAAGTAAVAGNVDGFNDPYTWNGAAFNAFLNTIGWADDEYCFVFNPADDAGYPDVRKTVTFTIDNTPPAKPTLLSPGNGVPVSGDDLVNDWNDVAGAHHYTYQSYNVNGSGNCNLSDIRWTEDYVASNTNTRDVADLTFCWRVKAVDELGNESEWSDLWKTVVDNTLPSAPVITSPTDEQYFTATPILNQWTAATDANGIAKYQIAYHYDDGHAFVDSTCPGLAMSGVTGFIGCRDLTGTQRNHTPSTSEQGGVTIWVRALDNAGHWSAWSLPVHYYYDATAPEKPQILGIYKGHNSNEANFLGCGGFTNNVNIRIDWATNPDSDVAYYWFGTKFNTKHKKVTANTHYDGNMTPGNNPYYYTVIAVDHAGNESPISEPCYLTLDQDLPAIEINGTAPKATYKMNEPINVHVIDDNFDRVEVDRIDAAAPDNDKHWVYTGEWFGLWWLQDGTYRLTAYDKAGNTTVHEFITDETKPVVTGSTEPAFNPASFTITATDNSSGIQRVTGNIYKYDPTHPNADSEGYHLFKGNSSTTQNPFTVALDSLDEGQYYVKYNAQDIVGNTSNTEKFYFTVDHTAPVVTVDDYTGTDTTPDITGTVDDLSITTITVTVNGESHDVTPVAGVWTLLGSDLVAPLAVGTYDVTASATDAAGNTGTDATTDEVTVEAEEGTNGETQGALTNNSFNENQGDNGNQNNGQDGNGEEEKENKAVESLNTTSSGDEDNTELIENAASTGKFLGLGWWWAAILGALAILWLLFGARRSEDKN